MPAEFHCFDWNAPGVHLVTVDGMPSAAAAGSASGETDGRSMEIDLASAEGRWANCDVHINAPATWWAANPQFRLYATGFGKRSLLAEVEMQASNVRDQRRGLLLSSAGHACEGYLLVGRSLTAIVGEAQFSLETWGTEVGGGGGSSVAGANVLAPQLLTIPAGVGTFSNTINVLGHLDKEVQIDTISGGGTFQVYGRCGPTAAFLPLGDVYDADDMQPFPENLYELKVKRIVAGGVPVAWYTGRPA